jgi:uncharacterized protein YueI
MNIAYLDDDDWAHFKKTYPDAARYLLGTSLARERIYLYLSKLKTRTPWQQLRLEELEKAYEWTAGLKE